MADTKEELRIGGEVRVVSIGVADAHHLAGTEVSGRDVVLAG